MGNAELNTFSNCRVNAVTIRKSAVEKLSDFTRRSFPFEPCALLFGNRYDSAVDISEVVLVKNSLRSKNHFGVSSHDLSLAINSSDLSLCGVFHAHPRSLSPSRADISGIRRSNVPWLIGKLKNRLAGVPALLLRAYAARGEYVFVIEHKIN